jgi:hypothetical protein
MTVFHLTSNQLRVTDPCYTKGTWCAGVLENILPGSWIAEKVVATNKETGGWGDRIAELCIWHGDYIDNVDAHELTEIHVGVDSGQAGFFDESQYPEGETGEYMDLDTFYGKVCEGTKGEYRITVEQMYGEEIIQYMIESYAKDGKTLPEALIEHMKTATRTRSEPDYLGIANVGFGVATHSGYGDGGYNCYVGRNDKGEIVAARIVFISDEDEENDED